MFPRTAANLNYPLSLSQDLADTAKPLGQHWNPPAPTLLWSRLGWANPSARASGVAASPSISSDCRALGALSGARASAVLASPPSPRVVGAQDGAGQGRFQCDLRPARVVEHAPTVTQGPRDYASSLCRRTARAACFSKPNFCDFPPLLIAARSSGNLARVRFALVLRRALDLRRYAFAPMDQAAAVEAGDESPVPPAMDP